MRCRLAIAFLLVLSIGASAAEPNLSGRWRGRWSSESSGHSGPLNARFRQTGCDEYRVVFTGRFLAIVPFRYAETLHVTGSADGVVYLAGSSRLLGFGTFSFDAAATGNAFNATFSSRRDRGQFNLAR
jgi:hypothetical protein